MNKDIVARMTNLGESGQDEFVGDWSEMAKLMLYEQGVSKKYLESKDASFLIGKIVTDLIDDGKLSSTSEEILKTLRVNHPHSEDTEDVQASKNP